jgi:protein phosphatase 1 regulatory subunit 11
MVVGVAANQASTTVVTVSTVAAAQTEATAPTHLTLKLKRRRSRVRWAEDVVDNEDLCRKKSKKCCVFHRSRGLDESSDEEDGPEGLLANFLPPSSSEAGASSTE